jgi:hypothetical protein
MITTYFLSHRGVNVTALRFTVQSPIMQLNAGVVIVPILRIKIDKTGVAPGDKAAQMIDGMLEMLHAEYDL